MAEQQSLVKKAQEEINLQLADQETMNSLLNTTFNGLSPQIAKRAMLEGVLRGYTFEEFLKKDVYAIPYGGGYNLVTSIDHARKIGMRSGVVGKSAPDFKMDGDTIISCSVTIKRSVGGTIGEFTATVFFKEYTTGKNLWASKPHTMIAKVAEMHALRMACPEELAQSYTEEEFNKGTVVEVAGAPADLSEHETLLRGAKTIDELQAVWASLPQVARGPLEKLKNELKASFEKDSKKPVAKPVTKKGKSKKNEG